MRAELALNQLTEAFASSKIRSEADTGGISVGLIQAELRGKPHFSKAWLRWTERPVPEKKRRWTEYYCIGL